MKGAKDHSARVSMSQEGKVYMKDLVMLITPYRGAGI